MTAKLFWTIYYLGFWLGIVFCVPEFFWISNNPTYTLSDRMWGLEHLDRQHPFAVGHWTDVHWAVAIFVWLIFGWLSVHIPFGLAG